MNKTYLVIGLSEAEHLSDESSNDIQLVYAGPRFTTDNKHLRTSSKPYISNIVKYFESKNIQIYGIIIYADIFSLNLFRPVVDLDFINKICIVGDTHHGEKPISGIMKWLILNNIDTIALKQTINQYSLFESLGFNVLNLPYYAHDVKFIKPTKNYFERIVFVGSTGTRHPRRTNYINKLQSMGVPIDVCKLPRNQSFKAYNSYACSFNLPLNNDINYRIWEIMAGGGVCLTEYIPNDIQNKILAKENISVVMYKNFEECANKAWELIRDAQKRMQIAETSYRTIKSEKDNNTVINILDNAFNSMDICEHRINQIRLNATRLKYMLNCANHYENQQKKTLEKNLLCLTN